MTDANGNGGQPWTDDLAARFHEAYERLAPDFGYDTRPESAVPWEEVPEANRLLMRAVMADLFDPRMANDRDHEGFWWRTVDQRGWTVLTVRPLDAVTDPSGSEVPR